MKNMFCLICNFVLVTSLILIITSFLAFLLKGCFLATVTGSYALTGLAVWSFIKDLFIS